MRIDDTPRRGDVSGMAKTKYLQIRLSPEQKAELERRAARAGEDMSSYVLRRALPPEEERAERILVALRDDESPSFALAELNDLLWSLSPARLGEVTAGIDVTSLEPLWRNYVAAMVEQACSLRDVEAPGWTRRVEPLEEPYFATPLKALRLHLLKSSPVPFKRRNIFVDATIGDRV